MTNKDKAFLRWLIRNQPHRSDEYMADECECSTQTVRRYRKALSPQEPTP